MTINKIIDWGNSNPKKLFLIDGLGATISAVLLGIVLTRLVSFIGIPESTLYFLAVIPSLFAIYDFYCYLKIENKIGIFLKTIGIANLVYCCLSVGLAIYHRATITHLGWMYVLIEVMIVGLLAYVEMKVAKRLSKRVV